jgi:translation initiation factor IF-2
MSVPAPGHSGAADAVLSAARSANGTARKPSQAAPSAPAASGSPTGSLAKAAAPAAPIRPTAASAPAVRPNVRQTPAAAPTRRATGAVAAEQAPSPPAAAPPGRRSEPAEADALAQPSLLTKPALASRPLLEPVYTPAGGAATSTSEAVAQAPVGGDSQKSARAAAAQAQAVPGGSPAAQPGAAESVSGPLGAQAARSPEEAEEDAAPALLAPQAEAIAPRLMEPLMRKPTSAPAAPLRLEFTSRRAPPAGRSPRGSAPSSSSSAATASVRRPRPEASWDVSPALDAKGLPPMREREKHEVDLETPVSLSDAPVLELQRPDRPKPPRASTPTSLDHATVAPPRTDRTRQDSSRGPPQTQRDGFSPPAAGGAPTGMSAKVRLLTLTPACTPTQASQS